MPSQETTTPTAMTRRPPGGRSAHILSRPSPTTMKNNTTEIVCPTMIHPAVEEIIVTATARPDICPLSKPMTPANIANMTIMTQVRDPGHRLLHSARFARGAHADATTTTDDHGSTIIQSPHEFLRFQASEPGPTDPTGSYTWIDLGFNEPWLFQLQMFAQDLIGTHDSHEELQLADLWEFLRAKVYGLKGFNAIQAKQNSLPELSPAARSLVAILGDDVVDIRAVDAVLHKSGSAADAASRPAPSAVVAEVHAHAIQKIGLRLDEVFPRSAAFTEFGGHEKCAICHACPHDRLDPSGLAQWTMSFVSNF